MHVTTTQPPTTDEQRALDALDLTPQQVELICRAFVKGVLDMERGKDDDGHTSRVLSHAYAYGRDSLTTAKATRAAQQGAPV